MARKSCKFGVKKGGCRKRPRKGAKAGKGCRFGRIKRGPRKGRCRTRRKSRR